MKWRSIYEQYPPRPDVLEHTAGPRYCNQQTSPMSQMADSDLTGFSAEQELGNFQRKRRLCRHYLKGWCNRGNSCDFQHDASIFCSNEQMVFLGGLPSNITEKALRQALRMQGYTVLNKPKILQGFSPQICLGSVEEAQTLVRRGKILVKGAVVDVRPFVQFPKDNLKIDYEKVRRTAVFQGGLPRTTKGQLTE